MNTLNDNDDCFTLSLNTSLNHNSNKQNDSDSGDSKSFLELNTSLNNTFSEKYDNKSLLSIFDVSLIQSNDMEFIFIIEIFIYF